MSIRTQLGLFVPSRIGSEIEAIRHIVDPVQSRLIPAHVTLCREDELSGIGLPDVVSRTRQARQGPITLQFGPPERFGEHGILMPRIGGVTEFQSLGAVIFRPEGGRQRIVATRRHRWVRHQWRSDHPWLPQWFPSAE